MEIDELINRDVAADKSLVGRYFRCLEHLQLDTRLEAEDVLACSLREGATLRKKVVIDGVEVQVCDETSLMETGTYKDLDACLTVAIAKRAGYEEVVLSSGGNLNYSISRYAHKVGVTAYLFNPASTLFKLNQRDFSDDSNRLIAVDLPEKQVKEVALQFAKQYALLHVPDVRWRLAASAMRAMFLIETIRQTGPVHWLGQTMCAGYGPAGIFNAFSELSRLGAFDRERVPRFLGFQQASNAAMVHAWSSGSREIASEHVHADPSTYLEPGLYNTNPGPNYTRLSDLMRYYGGDMLAIDKDDYDSLHGEVESMLADVGVVLGRNAAGDVLEKTGLLTGVGILRAIRAKKFKPGERVLYMLTGGTRVVEDGTSATPQVRVDDSQPINDWVNELGEFFNLRPPTFSRRSDRLFNSR